MNWREQISAFLKGEFAKNKVAKSLRTLPSKYVDKSTGEEREFATPAYSYIISSKTKDIVDKALSLLTDTGEYLDFELQGTKYQVRATQSENEQILKLGKRAGETVVFPRRVIIAEALVAPVVAEMPDVEFDAIPKVESNLVAEINIDEEEF